MSDAVLIIQARLGSTRFPRKMLAPLGGKPIIEWVVERVLRSRFAGDVVVATTDLANDDELVAAVANYPVRVHRGPSEDVLARFAGAAATSGARHVVRICADNPFVDPACINVLVAEHLRRGTGYTFNHRRSTVAITPMVSVPKSSSGRSSTGSAVKRTSHATANM